MIDLLNPFTEFLTAHAHEAHWWIFCALILAGFNLPISEDLMLITSGMLASTLVPENTYILFTAVFLGCYLSDWISYGLGRTIGLKLLDFYWFGKSFKNDRLKLISNYYKKYGFLTLLIGRFIPFGVRNCLFITAGLSKMSFKKFIISDGLACFISNITLFSLSYSFGKNNALLLEYISQYNILVFSIFFILLISLLAYRYAFKWIYATNKGGEL